MKFHRLHITNFLTLSEAQVGLADRGLNLLQGKNLDDTSATSNGAGKSSLVDALCWVLFGETARGETGDAVINNQAGKGCRVQVIIEDNGSQFSITRHRKHKTGKNGTEFLALQPGGAVELHKGTEAETQKAINAFLGCDLEVFMASIYAGQEAMPDIPNMTDKVLKGLVEQAAGINRFEKAYKLASAEHNAVEAELKRLTDEVEICRRGEVQASTALGSVQSLQAGEAARLTTESAAKANDLAAKKVALKELAEKVVADQPKIDALAAKKAEASAKVAGVNAAIATARDFANGPLKAAQDAFTFAQAQFAQSSKKLQELAAQIGNVDALLGKPCGECGKPHTQDEKDELTRHLTTQAQALGKIVAADKEKVTSLSLAVDTQVTEHNRLSALVPDVSAVNAAITRIDEVLQAHEKLRMNLAARKTEIELLERELASAKVNRYDEALKLAEAARQKTRDDVVEAQNKLPPVQERLKIAAAVAKTLSPAGVRAHILDTVTPFLNDRTATYLGVLSDGNISAIWSTLSTTASGELREKFQIEVSNSKGGNRFKLLSGGEKRKVRLACMLALQDLTASRAEKPMELWVGDEIDDALDPAGLERLMTVLEMKARERGTVVVVSHADLTNWVDQVTTITKSGGFSTVTGALV